MLINPYIFGRYDMRAAVFDGANDYMYRAGMSGASDSKTGLLSFWFRVDGGNGTTRRVFFCYAPSNQSFMVFLTDTNKMRVRAETASLALMLSCDTNSSITASGSWRHILASWDGATSALHMYLDDISDKQASPTIVDLEADYTLENWYVGSTNGPAQWWNGCIAELYFAPGKYLDLSVTANRRKFISSTGKPVYLGALGQVPTGTQPLVYQRIASNGSAADFATNLGSGGNLTVNGALGVASDSPTNLQPAKAIVEGADFDGTNDHMARGGALTGVADSKTGIVSMWFLVDGFYSAMTLLQMQAGADNHFQITAGDAGVLQFFAADSFGTTVLGFAASTEFGRGVWYHVLASWDSSTGVEWCYVNDVQQTLTAVERNNLNIDYTTTNCFIGAYNGGGLKWDGYIAELYFAPGQYLDFSVAANRRKFRTADGKPAYLGYTGNLPTGTAPAIYQHLRDADAPANFKNNRGTGGDFTITGTLDLASTSPSD